MDNVLNKRHIRVFISSTFADMVEERDYIMRIVYPTLLEEASKHGVTLTFVDLRWGITEEESRSGKVISICLNEIDYSRPYFIGIVGARYGWTPKKSDISDYEDMMSRYPFIDDYINDELSVTEMEMRYGVLDSDKTPNALFFIKDGSLNCDTDSKLKNLCSLIEKSPNAKVIHYKSLNTLGTEIVSNFREHINMEFPLANATPYNRLRERLAMILNVHSTNYIGDFPDFSLAAEGKSIRLCFTAFSGQGKTATMAAIAEKLFKEKTNKIVYYSDEETITSKNFDALIEYIASSLIDDGLEYQSPWNKLKDAIDNITSKDKLYFILDGICTLKNCSDKNLLRLIKIIGSANILISVDSKSEFIPVLIGVGFKVQNIEIPNKSIKSIIINYLSRSRKSLSEHQIEFLSQSSYSSYNELYSKLDWLRMNASFESLNSDIEYLSTITTDEIYDGVCRNLKVVFGEEIVELFFSMTLCVSRGLKEFELCELLSISNLKWTMLHNACRSFMTEADGILNFTKDFCRFLFDNMDPLKIISVTDKLIEYFRTKNGAREYFILSDLYHCGSYNQELYVFLLNYAHFRLMYEEDEFGLAEYWRHLLGVDNMIYRLEAYNDIDHIEIVNVPVKADYDIISKFIKRHFSSKNNLMNKLLKHNEYDKNPFGVMLQTIEGVQDSVEYLSPGFLLSLARNSSNIFDAIDKYMLAVSRFRKEQQLQFKVRCLDEIDALDTFTAFLEMSKVALSIGRFKLVAECITSAEKILLYYLESSSYQRGRLICAIADYMMLNNKGYYIIKECQSLLVEDEIIADEDMFFDLSLVKMRASLCCDGDIEDVGNQSKEILNYIDTTYGRRNERYVFWLLNEIIFHMVANDFFKAGICFKEYMHLTKGLLSEKDLSFLNLPMDETIRMLYSLYETVGDIAAMKWYSQYCNDSLILPYNQELEKTRQDLVRDLIANPVYDEDEYLCRLIFEDENEYLDDKLFMAGFNLTNIYDPELLEVYKNFSFIVDNLGLNPIPIDLYGFLSTHGPTQTMHMIHIRIIEVWRYLINSYPSELGNVNILNDDEILDVAEVNETLRPYLITLVETMIEIGGFYITCREIALRISRDILCRERAMKNSIDQ